MKLVITLITADFRGRYGLRRRIVKADPLETVGDLVNRIRDLRSTDIVKGPRSTDVIEIRVIREKEEK